MPFGTSALSSTSCAAQICAPLFHFRSDNRFRTEQAQVNFAPRRFLCFLHEDPLDHHAPAHGCHIQGPRNSTTAFQPHFPEAAFRPILIPKTVYLESPA